MAVLPEIVSAAWENREGPCVLSTADADGVPNAIYATSVWQYSDDTMVIADNYFHKTRANILAESSGSLLFITKEGTSYQLKGSFTYHTEGAVFLFMKEWNPKRLPGIAAVALKVEHIYCGAKELV